MISVSRAPSMRDPDRRTRTISRQSGIVDTRDAADGAGELLPASALRGQYFPARGGDAVVAAAALAGFFHPSALDQTARFEPVKQRVERSGLKAQGAFGAARNQLADLVAVPGPV